MAKNLFLIQYPGEDWPMYVYSVDHTRKVVNLTNQPQMAARYTRGRAANMLRRASGYAVPNIYQAPGFDSNRAELVSELLQMF